MSCNKCKSAVGFVSNKVKARQLEFKSGKKMAIFSINEVSFIGEFDTVKYMTNLCCFYDIDGKEYKTIKKVIKKVIKKTEENKK